MPARGSIAERRIRKGQAENRILALYFSIRIGYVEDFSSTLAELFPELIDFCNGVPGQHLHCLVAGRHGHGVGVVSTAVRQLRLGFPGFEHRHDLGAAGDRADRKAAADDLAERGQMRFQIALALHPGPTGAECHHFVGDLYGAARITEVRNHRQEFIGRRDACQPLPDWIVKHGSKVFCVLVKDATRDLGFVERDDDDVVQHALRRAGRVGL